MGTDDVRARFLTDRVMTASPAQRVVMLYDRLGLDLARAENEQDDLAVFGQHLSHAMQVVAELMSSLDVSVTGPAQNLASIYAFMLREIIAIRRGTTEKLPAIRKIVSSLRDTWATVAQEVANTGGSPVVGAAAGSWVS